MDKSGEEFRKSQLLAVIQKILSQKNNIKIVTDMAFDSVDVDGSGKIDMDELKETLKDCAKDMGIPIPTSKDVEDILFELDQNND